jgi:hypothetical protein
VVDGARLSRAVRPGRERKRLAASVRAFETKGLGLVFRGAKGNIVRHGRVRADELNELVLYESTIGALHETHFWLDSEVGEKYQVDSEVVRQIVPFVKASEAS